MRLVVVSGLSGSGKSVALHMLEDLDYYCVDNIPAGLLPMSMSALNGRRRMADGSESEVKKRTAMVERAISCMRASR